MRGRYLALVSLCLTGVLGALEPAVAAASTTSAFPAPPIADVLGIGGAVKDVLGTVGGALVGGVNWTADLAGKFILNTLGGLVDLLIPDSWAKQGLSIMQWVVAVPNYAAHVGGPGGGDGYAFAGINDLRSLFVWLGLAILPLSLTYASTRAVFGLGDHVALPIVRTLAIGVVLLSYTWLWGQVAAICNQITKAILGVPSVAAGLNKLFEFIIAGGALAGLPLIGLIVMGAAGIALLAMIFVKVLMILLGAIIYVTGPLMLGLAPTERGEAAARAWLTLAMGLAILPILWATVFAIAALLMSDSSGAAAIIGTNSDLGKLLGGLVLGLAAIAGFWLNLKLTKFAAAILGGQVAGMLALATSGRGGGGAGGRGGPASAREALSSFGSKVGGAGRAARAPLAGSGRVGSMLAAGGAGAGALARGGLLGGGASAAKRGVGAASASSAGQALGGTKAGALATRMARAGRTGWSNPGAATSGGGTPSTTRPMTPKQSTGAGATTRDPRPAPRPNTGSQTSGTRGGSDRATTPAPRGSSSASTPPRSTPPPGGQGTPPTRASRLKRPRRDKSG